MPEPWAEWTTTVSISGAPLGDNENPELPVTARCSGADAIGYPIFDRPRRRVEGFVPPRIMSMRTSVRRIIPDGSVYNKVTHILLQRDINSFFNFS